jgi:hypothetical protein
MAIKLDPFSRLRSPFQGAEMASLVGSQGEWLMDQQPGTRFRYRDYPHAVKNIARLANHDTVKPFIVKKNSVAIGAATVILNQVLVNPDRPGKVITGNDVDYWLATGEDRPTHEAVARALIIQSHKLNDQPGFATIPVGQQNPAVGFEDVFALRTEPAPLAEPYYLESWDYGIAKNGVVGQILFQHPSQITTADSDKITRMS